MSVCLVSVCLVSVCLCLGKMVVELTEILRATFGYLGSAEYTQVRSSNLKSHRIIKHFNLSTFQHFVWSYNRLHAELFVIKVQDSSNVRPRGP